MARLNKGSKDSLNNLRKDSLCEPRLTADLFLDEDTDALLDQLRWLNNVNETQDITLVVSHDADQLRRQMSAGLLGRDFEWRRVIRGKIS